jgi:DNA-binding response OmpR family regulator
MSQDDVGARILIVDDEPHIRSALARAMHLMGYSVEVAGSGQEALALLGCMPYDVMVLDIFMPGIDGIEVMRHARPMCPELAIIVLTGRATLESAIAAVKSEAVDYLLKPVTIGKIAKAVMQALQRRDERMRRQRLMQAMTEALDTLRQAETPSVPSSASEIPPERFLHVFPLTLDRQKRQVVTEDDPARSIELTAGETAVLAGLMMCPDHMFPCCELVRAAWGYEMDEPQAQSVIRPYICRLRRKLEVDPQKPRLIHTTRGRGYTFVSSPNRGDTAGR